MKVKLLPLLVVAMTLVCGCARSTPDKALEMRCKGQLSSLRMLCLEQVLLAETDHLAAAEMLIARIAAKYGADAVTCPVSHEPYVVNPDTTVWAQETNAQILAICTVPHGRRQKENGAVWATTAVGFREVSELPLWARTKGCREAKASHQYSDRK